eukprot:GHVO01060034.1.p2 GENE.GHVO01060034.1~~GHVO01060034.1.p2  ORF type:complete len:111 (-),score=11.42 GHVO01060034.1:295-627(-)
MVPKQQPSISFYCMCTDRLDGRLCAAATLLGPEDQECKMSTFPSIAVHHNKRRRFSVDEIFAEPILNPKNGEQKKRAKTAVAVGRPCSPSPLAKRFAIAVSTHACIIKTG